MRTHQIHAACFVLYNLLAAHLAGQTCRTATPAEQAGIQELSERDKAASKSGDWQTLATLWTDDAVALPPGELPVVGIDAIRAWLERDRTDVSKVEVADYSIDIRGTRVCGDTAIQWGTTHIAMRPKGAPSGMQAVGNIERLLRRQADGSWKVQRAIWNIGKPTLAPPHEGKNLD